MESRIFHLQALSALHVGTGQGVGVVDLPIARSKATNLPLVPGSSLKGVLRDEWEKPLGKDKVHSLFGPYHQQEASFAGAIAFGDAHLLILPIRSFAGTVAYATCPFILKQYQRDLQLNALDIPVADKAIVTQDTALKLAGKVALEDLDIVTDTTNSADGWAEAIAQALYPDSVDWQQAFKARFVILPDNTFSFLADTATEIRTRIRIERETRIVKEGALWTEENLPTDSVLWGVMGISQARDRSGLDAKALSNFLPVGETALQLGGKHTVGRGLCRFLLNAVQE